MSMSLRDQLIQAGLVSEKKARESEQQQRQQQRRAPTPPRHAPPKLTPQQQAAQRAQAEKQVRDAELNRKKQEKAERRARSARLRQLVEQHALPVLPESLEFFNFVDGKQVRRVGVDAARRASIDSGALLIVRCPPRYALVPATEGARIRECDPNAIVELKVSEAEKTGAEEDPYKDFVVPDDLRW
jgi:uncharacterized protein